MSYTKTTWASGDTITAEKLNNAEAGIEAATPLYVPFTLTMEEGQPLAVTTTASFVDVAEAVAAGIHVVADLDTGGGAHWHLPNTFVFVEDTGVKFVHFSAIIDMGVGESTVEPTYAAIDFTSTVATPTLVGLSVST